MPGRAGRAGRAGARSRPGTRGSTAHPPGMRYCLRTILSSRMMMSRAVGACAGGASKGYLPRSRRPALCARPPPGARGPLRQARCAVLARAALAIWPSAALARAPGWDAQRGCQEHAPAVEHDVQDDAAGPHVCGLAVVRVLVVHDHLGRHVGQRANLQGGGRVCGRGGGEEGGRRWGGGASCSTSAASRAGERPLRW
jgi:hypothetical protein